MIQIKKALTIKIINLVIPITFLCSNLAYSSDISYLRVPIGDKGRFDMQVLDKKIQEELRKEGRGHQMWDLLDQRGKKIGEDRDFTKRWDIQVALTNQCPFIKYCEHCCAIPWMKGKKKEMDVETIKAIIDNVARGGTICLTGGEPTLWKHKSLEDLKKGHFSEEFLEILKYAKEKEVTVVIDTSGLWIPTDIDSAETIEIFKQLPDNVILELSLDVYHAQGLKEYGKNPEAVVKAVKSIWVEKLGRKVYGNLRYVKDPRENRYQFKTIESILDIFDGWASIESDIKVADEGRRRETQRVVTRESTVKFQGASVNLLAPTGPYDINITPMNVVHFLDDFLLRNSLPCVGPDGKVTFSPHALYMNDPPLISQLGSLAGGKSMAEVMLDGVIGRAVGFERFPCLRYLYLACYFLYIEEDELSERCFTVAKQIGAQYESEYRAMTGGATFKMILEQFQNDKQMRFGKRKDSSIYPYEMKKLYYFTTILNFVSLEVPQRAMLRNIIPFSEKAAWGWGRRRDSEEVLGTDSPRKLKAICFRDFIRRCEEEDRKSRGQLKILDKLIGDTVENFVGLLQQGGFPRDVMLVVNPDKGLRYFHLTKWDPDLPDFHWRDVNEVLDAGKVHSFELPPPSEAFKDFVSDMHQYFGEYSGRFFEKLKKSLENALEMGNVEGKIESQDKKMIVAQLIEICQTKIKEGETSQWNPEEDIGDILLKNMEINSNEFIRFARYDPYLKKANYCPYDKQERDFGEHSTQISDGELRQMGQRLAEMSIKPVSQTIFRRRGLNAGYL